MVKIKLALASSTREKDQLNISNCESNFPTIWILQDSDKRVQIILGLQDIFLKSNLV